MADEPKRGVFGEFMHQFNEVLKEVIEASQGPAPGGGYPRPRTGAPAMQPRLEQPVVSMPEQPAEPARKADSSTGEVRNNIGESKEQRDERQHQHRIAHERAEQERKRKLAAFNLQQDKFKHEQHKADTARGAKKAEAGATAAARRYGKFLLAKPQNVRDAVMLAEIIGPCLALKDRR